MIVADASVVIDLILGGSSPAADRLAEHLLNRELVVAPHLIDAEVGQAIRRFNLSGDLDDPTASTLVQNSLDLPVRRQPHRSLLARAFELRANVSVYDGLYLALAEALGCPLLTGDRALLNVPGCSAEVEYRPTTG